MCLNYITQQENLPDSIIGYKVVVPTYQPLYYGSMRFELNTEITDISWHRINAISYQSYPSGFHVFRNLSDALNFGRCGEKIIKVLCKNIICVGKQDVGLECISADVIVCKTITNLGDCDCDVDNSGK